MIFDIQRNRSYRDPDRSEAQLPIENLERSWRRRDRG
jgi:hypothetical protein